MVVLNNTKNRIKSTVVVYGVREDMKSQVERSVKRAVRTGVSALRDGAFQADGTMYLKMARAIRKRALERGDRESIAMNAYADVLDDIFKTLAENSGHDSLQAYADAMAIISRDLDEEPTGPFVPSSVLKAALRRASESAETMIRIDETLSAKRLTESSSFGGSGGVTIYTSEGCPWCARTKEFLRSKGVSFREINVSRNPAAVQEMIAVSGQTGTPVTVINGQAVVGFDQARLEALLK